MSQTVAIPAMLLVSAFARAPGRLRVATAGISAAMLAGFTGLLLALVAQPIAWAVLVGFGQCSLPWHRP
ncbi:hypothetical protein ACFXB4_16155 [Streptomyces lavendulae]|uniref:hypothetical protein n=1 Tax=Streptomyces lavendulae TaxID=1914 RepID=UPI00368A09BF